MTETELFLKNVRLVDLDLSSGLQVSKDAHEMKF